MFEQCWNTEQNVIETLAANKFEVMAFVYLHCFISMSGAMDKLIKMIDFL